MASYNRAVIFYNERKKLKRESDVFDIRFDTQLLPWGQIVCGLIFVDAVSNKLVVALDPPALTEGQLPYWHQILDDAYGGLEVAA